MKIRQDEMAVYHMQKQITRFYSSAIRVVWGLLCLMILWTGFRVYAKDSYSYLYDMLWYIVPVFVLGIITGLLWVLRKREQNKTYQKMLVRWQREKTEIHLVAKAVDHSGM